ncbi:MAG: tetratricopeptide repeat protein [bacterium]|nr:tetratricopeptide repeat protein [bacterium]
MRFSPGSGSHLWKVLSVVVVSILAAGCAEDAPVVKLTPALRVKAEGTAESYFHFIQGYHYEIAGQIQRAESEYAKGLEKDPYSPELLSRLASLKVRRGLIEAGNRRANLLLGGIYRSQGKLPMAVEAYQRILKDLPADREALLLLGTLYIELRRGDDSVRIFRRLLAENGDDVLGRYYLARSLILQRKLQEARRELVTLTQERPRFVRGFLLLGRLHEELNDLGAAERAYKRALAVSPDNQLARARLGSIYIRKNNIKGALQEYEKLKQEAPDNPEVHRTLGILRFDQRDYESALREFRFVLARRPKDEIVRRYVAAIYQELKQYDLAEKELHELIRLVPGSAEGRAQLVRLLIIKKEEKKAEEALVKAESVLPNDSRFPFLRGVLFAQRKEYARALPFFQRAVKLKSSDVEYRFRLATIHYELKQWDETEKEIRDLLRLQPKHTNALNLLGYMFSELNKNISEAEKLLDRALAIEPTNSAFLDSIGWIYYRQGRYQEALKKVQHALVKNPKDAVILDHMGDIHFALKNTARALEFWEQSYKADPKNNEVREKIRRHKKSASAPGRKGK